MKLIAILSLTLLSFGAMAQNDARQDRLAQAMHEQREQSYQKLLNSKISDKGCKEIEVLTEKSCTEGGLFNWKEDSIIYRCLAKKSRMKGSRDMGYTSETYYKNVERSVDYRNQGDCQDVLNKFYL